MPAIAILIACYRSDKLEGIHTQLVRDHNDEDLAVELNQIRKRCDQEYAAFLSAGGTQAQALLWMQWYLRDVRRRRDYNRDVQLSIQAVGIVDLMERIGAFKRNKHNGLYVAFADPLPTSE